MTITSLINRVLELDKKTVEIRGTAEDCAVITELVLAAVRLAKILRLSQEHIKLTPEEYTTFKKELDAILDDKC